MKVLAVGPPAASGDSPTLNAIVTPGAPPLTTLKTVYPQQVAALGATLVSQSDVVVDGRPALRVSLKLPAGGRDLVSTQIIVPADGRTVIVSIANADPALLEQLVAAIVVPRR